MSIPLPPSVYRAYAGILARTSHALASADHTLLPTALRDAVTDHAHGLATTAQLLAEAADLLDGPIADLAADLTDKDLP